MSSRTGEKRDRSSGGRESDTHAPPRKQSRVEEDSDENETDTPDFSFSQMQAQTQDEQEAIQRTNELSMVSTVQIRANRFGCGVRQYDHKKLSINYALFVRCVHTYNTGC